MTAEGDREWKARRREFLDARRHSSRVRFDTIHSSVFDRNWGAISASHAGYLDRLLDLTRAGGTVLDVACGTGKYWPTIRASGRTVIGTDQSAGMLGVARAKYPDVPTGLIGLQELSFDGIFDAVVCIDGMEYVGPEDSPAVVALLARAARVGAPLYVTVELAEPSRLERAYEEGRAAGHPVVPGEEFDGVGYHYYPPRASVLAWLREAGLELIDEAEGDEYWHLLSRRAVEPSGQDAR